MFAISWLHTVKQILLSTEQKDDVFFLYKAEQKFQSLNIYVYPALDIIKGTYSNKF